MLSALNEKYSFLQVANSPMCSPIWSLTEAKGHDVAKHHLASFGGAGGHGLFTFTIHQPLTNNLCQPFLIPLSPWPSCVLQHEDSL